MHVNLCVCVLCFVCVCVCVCVFPPPPFAANASEAPPSGGDSLPGLSSRSEQERRLRIPRPPIILQPPDGFMLKERCVAGRDISAVFLEKRALADRELYRRCVSSSSAVPL